MRLGGTVTGRYACPEEWEELLVRSRFRAVTAPFDCRTDDSLIDRFRGICRKHDVVIAEAGVWRNLMDPNPAAAADALSYAKGQLRMADRLGIPCCVNIVGTASHVAWDAADKSNYSEETYERIVGTIREILDEVRPERAYYCIEPMPWMVPDGPDEYLRLIRDVDRPMFGAHMDFVNMINCPRRFLGAEGFIEECFTKLAPYIKSTHIKDSRMHPTRLTTVLEECPPGEGMLDFEGILRVIGRCLGADAPVLLEHMATEEEYARAYAFLAEKAAAASVRI